MKGLLSMNNPILLGVVSGVITYILIFGIIQISIKVVTPWFRGVIYNGHNVEGTWEVVSASPPSRRNASFTLTQKASKISGVSTHVLKDESMEGDYIKNYSLKGELRAGFIYLIVNHTDKKRIGFGTVVLKIVGDGQKMEGWIAAYNSSSSDVKGIKCTVVRKNSLK